MTPVLVAPAKNTKSAVENKYMQLKDLKKFIKKEDQRLRESYGNYKDEEKRILARTVKLTEELGELCDEVLSYVSLQRKVKLDKHDKNNLPGEFADVVITTLLLAEVMKVDIEEALKGKIKKINARYKK
ncbi:MAG: MazG nucleotide pyrophosphohydrolase domain-containing protein [Candidatus Azambacteria bacterium]|nr:MazG nucleotide pyrophosphohydrolase domain-containing protein [Candidatus Azambacteria bacterium]